jgi:hypothetical protein
VNASGNELFSTLIDAPRPALAVDFKEFSNKTTLSEALTGVRAGAGLLRVDAVTAVGRTGTGIAATAAACARELLAADRVPEVILGYCSAAGLALSVAESLLGLGAGPVPIVLVEPTWPTDKLIRLDAAALGGEGGYQGAVERDGILAALAGPLALRMREDGLDEDEIELCVALLMERYRAWFDFLFAARDAVVPAGSVPARVVLADDGERFAHPDWPATVPVERFAGRSGTLLAGPDAPALLERLCAAAVGR